MKTMNTQKRLLAAGLTWLVWSGFLFSCLFLEARESGSLKLEMVDARQLTIDGQLSEPLYRSGAWQEHFMVAPNWDDKPLRHEELKPAQHPSKFRTFTDGRMLYVVLYIEEKGEPTTVLGGSYDEMGRGDYVEVYVRANEDETEFYSFRIDPAGKYAAASYSESGLSRRFDWDPSLQLATGHLKGAAWVVELAVPLAELQARASHKNWAIQVVRNRQARGGQSGELREISAWSPVLADGVDKPQWFGKLKVPDNFEGSLLRWAAELLPSSIQQNDGSNRLVQKLVVTNQTGRNQNIVVAGKVTDGALGDSRVELTIDKEQSKEVVVDVDLTDIRGNEASIAYNIYLKGDESVPLFTAYDRVSLEYKSAQIILEDPGYRSTIFSTQNLDTIRGRLVQIDLSQKFQKVEVKLDVENGERITGVATKVEDHVWELEVPGILSVPEGTHYLEAWVNGKMQLSRRIRKLPFLEGEMWIDRHGVVYRNGKPFPAYGFIFSGGREFNMANLWHPQMHFNVFAPPGPNPTREPPYVGTHDVLNKLGKDGIYTGVYVWGAATGLSKRGNKPLTEDEKDQYRAFARSMKSNPNLLYYYQMDEPEHRGRDVGVVPSEEIYQVLAEADPYHPVLVTNHRAEAVRNYQKTADIFSPDAYPAFMQGRGGARPVNVGASYLQQAVVGEESYRARWKTPQAFNFLFFQVKNSRGPTATEMRAQQVVSIANGATGIVWYPEHQAFDEPGVHTSLPYLSREFLALFPYLCGPRPEVLDYGRKLDVALLSRDNGATLLFVTNAAWEEQSVLLEDKRFASVKRWRKLGTSEIVSGGTAQIRLELDRYEAVILASDQVVFPDDLRWQEVLDAELKEVEKRQLVIDGTISHYLNGTTVEIKGTGSISPSRAIATIDGMSDPRGHGFNVPQFRKGAEIHLQFNEVKQPRKIRFIGANVNHGRFEALIGEEWKEVARVDNPDHLGEEGHVREYQLPDVSTQRIRLVVDSLNEGESRMRIMEIEIYE